jgi:nicotinamidase/pyrazinamidase
VFEYGPGAALVVVDVQNDFADRKGSLYVSGAEEVVEPINDQVRSALGAPSAVVYTQDWHPLTTPHFAKDGGTWPVHCVAGSWGARLVPALEVAGPVVRKGVEGEDGYSGFRVRDPVSGEERPTGLGGLLRERGIRCLGIVGLATDYCVKWTALDAVEEGFETVVFASLTRPVELMPGDGAAALGELSRNGVRVE